MLVVRSLNIRQIEAFKAVMEAGTVVGGAALLNVSQPAVSKLIAHLEIDTALELFARERGRLIPTEAAHQLYEEVERTFFSLRQIEAAVETIRIQQHGRIRLGVMPALSGGFGTAVIEAFLARHPDVIVELYVQGSLRLSEAVGNGTLDIAIGSNYVSSDAVRCERILPLPLVCVMPHGHHLSARSIITPQDLQCEDFIRFRDHVATGAIVTQLLQKHGIEVRNRIHVDLVHPARELIAAGLGISLLHPLYTLGQHNRLALRPFSDSLSSELFIVHANRRRNTRLVGDMLREIRAVATTTMADIAARSRNPPFDGPKGARP